MARRNYSDKEKADALAVLKSNGDNILKTSQDTGIPITTLWNWARGIHGMNDNIPKLESNSKEELSNIFERVARKYLAHSESDLAVSSTYGNVAVQAAATATDRMQLLRGQPTSISGESSDVKASLLRRIQKISIRSGGNVEEIERELQIDLSDKSDEDYSPDLDASVHPEVWPSGSLLDKPQSVETITEIGDQ